MPQQLSPEDKKLVLLHIEQAMKDIEYFAENFLKHLLTSKIPAFHKEIYGILPRNKRVVISSFRGSGKSTVASVIYSIWLGVNNRKSDITIISASETLAVELLRKVKREFETNQNIIKYFGDLRTDKWSETHATLTSGVNFRARGAGSQIRGFRPDCHVKGTEIIENGNFIKIEDCSHKKISVVSDVIDVMVHGIPYRESVTPNHRYWAIKKTKKNDVWYFNKPSWVYANDLTLNHYIGNPIDTESNGLQPIDVYKPGIITERDSKGRVKSAGVRLVREIPDIFNDADFWWAVGLWWGDGHIAGRSIGWTVSDKKTHKRLCQFIRRHGSYFLSKRTGCWQVIFPNAALSRWLKSWRTGNAIKTPPVWVRKLDDRSLSSLVMGYVEADGYIDKKTNQIRVTSVHYKGLLVLADILSRLGVPSSIRSGIDGGRLEICGIMCNTRKKYDIMFRDGASKIGFNTTDSTRYLVKRWFIRDGFLWRKIRSVNEGGEKEVVPITTPNSVYKTSFGLSHNCLILDDIETDELVESEEQRRKLKDWLFKSCLNTLMPEGQLILVGSVLHPLSLIKDILTMDNGWVKKNYMAYKDFVEQPGYELWPDVWDHEKLQARKREIGSRAFSSEYLNSPSMDDTVPIKEEHIKYWETLPEQLNMVISVDPAYSEDENADYKVAALIAMDNRSNRYLVTYVRTHAPSGEFMDAIINMWFQNKTQITKVGIPNSGVEKQFFTSFLDRCNERKIYPPICEIKNSFTTSSGRTIRGKVDRIIAALQPIFEQGKFLINRNHTEAREELLTISSAMRHDDLVDSIAASCQLLEPTFFDASPKESEFAEPKKIASNYGYA